MVLERSEKGEKKDAEETGQLTADGDIAHGPQEAREHCEHRPQEQTGFENNL